VKARRDGRVVSVAVGVSADGRREVLGLAIGASEAETFWTDSLRKLARRGLRGVKLVVSDAHEGLKAAIAEVLNASWQRCRIHFMRNALAHAGKQGRRVVAAFNHDRRSRSTRLPVPLSYREESVRVALSRR
jgi:putative transposase